MRFYICLDVGGTNIKFGYFSAAGELLDTYKIPTPNNNLLENIVVNFSNNYNLDNCLGIAFGLPGVVAKNTLYFSPNTRLPLYSDLNKELHNILGNKYNFPIQFINDANLAAIGEYYYNNFDNLNVVMITLGTGVGGGIVINNKIIEGEYGFAGEIGHIEITSDETCLCGCGKENHAEGFLGANKIIAKFEKTYNLTNQSIATILEYLDNNYENYKDIIIYIVKHLNKLLSTISLVIDPACYIIGGGVSEALGKYIIPELEKITTKKVVIAKLKNKAALYGGYYLLSK